MTSAETSPRSIDHLVLPTARLDTARERLSALGFTVAPNGVHPFGTENACVYLADGTFLEPLIVGDAEKAREAVGAGNVFVARDEEFRRQVGEEGFSALVFASDDARADHSAFADAGMSAGEMLAFSRPFVDGVGRADTASFLLAFAAIGEAAPFFFACERVNAPDVDRASLERHDNGVVSIAGVTIVADDPDRIIGKVATIAGAAPGNAVESRRLELSGGAVIDVVDPAAFARHTGTNAPRISGFALAAVTFRVADPAVAERLLKANGIGCEKRGGSLIVPAAAGQGAVFMFEEVQ
ncbi:VOC family protein [Mesorhizobium xinjiangense]|uniref:VOC family protein n=1 Tax=Mesorhizobium xinjiangense TaxID=2678685 RepID=UPI0012EE8D20|nr:VOC family protein [Mesorhizobium xinjiangense]